MIRYLIILVVLGGAGIFIFWNILKFVLSVQNSRGKIKKEIQKSLGWMRADRNQLAPWNKEELELLSVVPGQIDVNRGLNRSVTGSLKNIYEEEVFKFAFKEYFSSKYRGFLLAVSSKHEFVYKMEDDRVDVFLNGNQIGNITSKGSFRNIGGYEVLTLDEIHNDAAMTSISSADKKVALIANPSSSNLTNDRALQLLDHDHPDVKVKEEELLALATFELVRNFGD